MARDSYSNDHTIKIVGDTQTLTVDGNLEVTGETTAGNFTAEDLVVENLTVNDLLTADVADLNVIFPDRILLSSGDPLSIGPYGQSVIITPADIWAGYYRSKQKGSFAVLGPNYAAANASFGRLRYDQGSTAVIYHSEGNDDELHECVVNITNLIPDNAEFLNWRIRGGDLVPDPSHVLTAELIEASIVDGTENTVIGTIVENSASSSWNNVATIGGTVDKSSYHYYVKLRFEVEPGGSPGLVNQAVYSIAIAVLRTNLTF